MMYSSNDALQELGLSDLRTQRTKHEVTRMNKVSTGEAPFYLTDKFSKSRHEIRTMLGTVH